MKDILIKSKFKNYKVKFTDVNNKLMQSIVSSNDFLLVDRNVKKKFSNKINFINFNCIFITATEKTKDYEYLSNIIKKLIKLGIKRNDSIISIGGGITQDISSFIASIMFRGISWRFIPTTLLAQGDSCIGGKTSINFKGLKNQVGNFYPPDSIYIDSNFIKGLKKNDIISGIGEMTHYFYVDSEKKFNFLNSRIDKVLRFDSKSINEIIYESLKIKKRFIEADEFDNSKRLLLNYGHTFGHAIESSCNYSIPHGIAVSYGMDMANFLSMNLGFISIEKYFEMKKVLIKIYKKDIIKAITVKKLINALKKDKKNIDSDLRFIATKGYGKMFIHKIEMNKYFYGVLNKYLAN